MDSTQEIQASAKMALTHGPLTNSIKTFLPRSSETLRLHCVSNTSYAYLQHLLKIPCDGIIPRAFSKRLLGPWAARPGWKRFLASRAWFALISQKVTTTKDLQTGLSHADGK